LPENVLFRARARAQAPQLRGCGAGNRNRLSSRSSALRAPGRPGPFACAVRRRDRDGSEVAGLWLRVLNPDPIWIYFGREAYGVRRMAEVDLHHGTKNSPRKQSFPTEPRGHHVFALRPISRFSVVKLCFPTSRTASGRTSANNKGTGLKLRPCARVLPRRRRGRGAPRWTT